jgi:hypothetical protein
VSRIPRGEDPPAPKASGRPTSEARSFRAAKVARGRARSAESTHSPEASARPQQELPKANPNKEDVSARRFSKGKNHAREAKIARVRFDERERE